MDNLYRLLQNVKQDPVMYLDKPSITSLHSFLIGYLSARRDLELDREGSGIEGFKEWVQERAKTNVCQSWAGIILFGSGSERSAFYRFFKEFDFFNQDKKLKNQENERTEKSRTTEDDLNLCHFDIYNELLGSIKKRPGMYLGTSSITKLDMLLRGYNLARTEVGIAPTEQERKFEGFQAWAKIILFYSVDEYEALEKFFELYEEYLNRDKSLEVDEGSKHIKV